MTKRTDPIGAEKKLPQRRSLNLKRADLSALASATEILFRELENFIELPGYLNLNWAMIAFAAFALEQEMMKLTPDLALPEHADAVLPLYGPCSTEKAVPFRDLWVLLREARPDPRGCGEHAGGVWVPGPNNLENARAIAQRLRPIVKRLPTPAPIAVTPKFIHSPRTKKILEVLNGKSKKLVQLAQFLKVTQEQLSGRELKQLKKAGLINWDRRIGYYRLDAPPLEVVT
jgi:hypothetical protein